jgi:phenylacetate-coenzyme A ligase PaaK-like adenylate-forming protein
MNLCPEDIIKEYTEESFNEQCLKVFKFQAKNNQVYSDYISLIKANPNQITHYTQIPFLPISLFKSQKIYASSKSPDIVFYSSTTTGQTPSKHLVADKSFYERSFRKAFSMFYGNVSEYCVLGLLPNYLERSGSSLVYMVNDLIKQSNDSLSNFYLYNFNDLANVLVEQDKRKKVLLIGVTFALLDFAEQFKLNLKQTIVIETGGMKGRKSELTRQEVHQIIKESLGVKQVHSEYGMTELLSQAYAQQDGLFKTPPWMRVLIRETNDPFSYVKPGKQGGINIIDLANYYSCSFIATDDLGRITPQGFEVLGRFDASDIRGCNLMVV